MYPEYLMHYGVKGMRWRRKKIKKTKRNKIELGKNFVDSYLSNSRPVSRKRVPGGEGLSISTHGSSVGTGLVGKKRTKH